MRAPVTWLYVPGDRPDRFDKALHSGADVVILDLEDAVHAAAKDQARDNVSAYLSGQIQMPDGVAIHLRINDVRSSAGVADLDVVPGLPTLSGLRVPKVTGPSDVDVVAQRLNEPLPVYALLESAAGVENATETAQHRLVAGIALGEADLRSELGLTDTTALAWLRTRVVVSAAAAGLPPVAMAVYTNVRDAEGLAASCEAGRSIGMFGRAAIHPAQLTVIRRAFAPTEEEVTHARAVMAAADDATPRGVGAVALPDGQFIDAPVIANARRILELNDRLGEE